MSATTETKSNVTSSVLDLHELSLTELAALAAMEAAAGSAFQSAI